MDVLESFDVLETSAIWDSIIMKKGKVKRDEERKGREKKNEEEKEKRKGEENTKWPSYSKRGLPKIECILRKWRLLLANFYQYRAEFLLNGQQLKQCLEGWSTQRKVMCKLR